MKRLLKQSWPLPIEGGDNKPYQVGIKMNSNSRIENAYKIAREQYQTIGVDVEKAMQILETINISLHCWQGDDVGGFESDDSELTGGIQVTGNYPGKARNANELRMDLNEAFRLIPGKHRLNLHAIYAETNGQKVERDNLQPKHFQNWIDWAKEKEIGLDFNGTFFSHPKFEDGFTLGSSDRGFWK